MNKLLRIAAYLVLALVALVAASAVIVPQLIDPNDHRERIAALVTERTGRDARIAGPIELTVFPWLGVTLSDVALGNAPGFDAPRFASAERLEARVKLLPLLLERAVEMDTVRLVGLELDLARAEDGRTNWEDLAAAGAGAQGGSTGDAGLGALALGGVDVSGATLRFDDRRSGQQLEVRGLDLRTDALALDAPVPFEAGFDLVATEPALTGRVQAAGALVYELAAGRIGARDLDASARLAGAAIPSGAGTVTVTGEAAYDPAAGRVDASALAAAVELDGDGPGAGSRVTVSASAAYDLARRVLDAPSFEASATAVGLAGVDGTVEGRGALRVDTAGRLVDAQDLALTADLRGAALPGGALALETTASVRADLGAGTVAVSDLQGRLPALALPAGTARLDLDARSIAGSLESRRLRASGLAVRGEVAGEALPGGRVAFDASADVEADLAASRLTVTELALAAGELRASGQATVSGLDAQPSVEATLAVERASLRTLAALADVELPTTRDPDALATVGGEATVAAGGGRLEVERMRITLDESTISGTASVPDPSLRGARFDITIDRLDADRYLPPGTPAGAASPGAAAAGAATLPLEQLRALDLDGRLRVGRLRAGGLDLANVDARLVAKDGMVRLSPARAGLYGGSYAGNVALDARGDTLALSVDERLESVDAATLVGALGGDPAALGLTPGKSSARLSGSLSGDPGAKRYRLRSVALDADVAGARFPGGRLRLGLGGAYDVDLAAGTATSDAMALRFGALEATGKVSATRLLDDPQLAGNLSTSRFNPRQLLGELGADPVVTADPNALSSAALSSAFTASSNAVSLQGMSLALDQSRISGDLEVSGFDQPRIRANVDVDAIDLDRYLPPSKGRVAAPPGAAAALIPVDTLRALDLDGELRIGELRVGGVRASNARVTATAKDGAARFHPLGAELYGGVYQGDVTVDARSVPPTVSLDERLSGTEIGALVTDMKGRTRLSGRTDLGLRLTARGQTADALKRSLNGDIALEVRDGAFRGMDLSRRICEGLAGQRTSARSEGEGAVTRFSSMTGTAQVRDGIVASRDLLINSPLLQIAGGGGASLVDERLDVNARVVLAQACQREQGLNLAGVDLTEIARVGVPIRCRGTFERPGCGPDADFIAQYAAQKAIERAIGGSLGGFLGGAQGGPSRDAQGNTGQGSGGSAEGDALQGILQQLLK